MGTKKAEALHRVTFWDIQEKEKELSLVESEERVKARDGYKKWTLLEEVSWRQKSKELWLKDGDRNIGFFHKMVNSHIRRSAINKLRVNGSWLIEDTTIHKGVVDTFKSLLSDRGEWCPTFPDIPLDVIENEDSRRLEDKFSENEVLAAISGLNEEKALGPDGFPIMFWSFSWEFVKDEVMEFFKEFYEQKKFMRNLNTTFVVMIPTKRNGRGYQRLQTH